MANVIRIKRRASGNAGAPAALGSAELAHNEVDGTLYIGKGDDGSGNATSVIPLAGKGAFADLASSQTVGGAKTFSIVPKSSQDASGGTDLVRKSQIDSLLAAKAPLVSPAFTGTPTAPTAAPATNTTQIATTAFVQEALSAAGAGDMAKAVYDTTGNGKVDVAEMAEAVPWTGVTGKPSSFPPSAHNHPTSEVIGLDAALAAKAPLTSPDFIGTPTAPTAAAGANTTQIATTAFVAAAITAIVNGAPGALDTLNELAAAPGAAVAQVVPPVAPCNNVSGTTVTCTGNLAAGISIANNPPIFDTLNVSTTTLISPASGTNGILFTSGQNVTVNSTADITVSGANADGIEARTSFGGSGRPGGNVVIGSTGTIVSGGGRGIYASAGNTLTPFSASVTNNGNVTAL